MFHSIFMQLELPLTLLDDTFDLMIFLDVWFISSNSSIAFETILRVIVKLIDVVAKVMERTCNICTEIAIK
jgi:hypothetical protein